MSRTEMTKAEPQSIREKEGQRYVACDVDVYENQDEFLLRADLPGFEQDKLEINLADDELTVEAHQSEHEGGTMLRCEAPVCHYQRRFTMPTGVDGGKVSAELKNGVLELHLPKSEAVKPRKIEVRAG